MFENNILVFNHLDEAAAKVLQKCDQNMLFNKTLKFYI